MNTEFDSIRKIILDFRNQRDWKQFHDPKNLAEGLSIEAAELLENFLWKTVEESKALTEDQLKKVRHEVADIFVFLVYICEELNIDLFSEVIKKIKVNEQKYPVDKSKGNSKKYTEL